MSDNEQFSARQNEDLWEFEVRQKSAQRLQRIFQIYALLGALVGIFSIAYFFLKKIQINLSPEDQIILLTSGSGFAISITSVIYLFLRKQSIAARSQRVRHLTSASEFLMQWAGFEEVARAYLAKTGKTFNRTSIKDIVAGLLDAGVLQVSDISLVEEALRFRSSLVHSGSTVDLDSIGHMTQTVRRLVDKVGSARPDELTPVPQRST